MINFTGSTQRFELIQQTISTLVGAVKGMAEMRLKEEREGRTRLEGGRTLADHSL